MPHTDQSPQEALDAVAASTRCLSAAYADLTTHVHGAEAQRVARVLEFEVDQLNAAVSILRKAFGDRRDAERVAARIERGEAPRPSVPVTAAPITEATR